MQQKRGRVGRALLRWKPGLEQETRFVVERLEGAAEQDDVARRGGLAAAGRLDGYAHRVKGTGQPAGDHMGGDAGLIDRERPGADRGFADDEPGLVLSPPDRGGRLATRRVAASAVGSSVSTARASGFWPVMSPMVMVSAPGGCIGPAGRPAGQFPAQGVVFGGQGVDAGLECARTGLQRRHRGPQFAHLPGQLPDRQRRQDEGQRRESGQQRRKRAPPRRRRRFRLPAGGGGPGRGRRGRMGAAGWVARRSASTRAIKLAFTVGVGVRGVATSLSLAAASVSSASWAAAAGLAAT